MDNPSRYKHLETSTKPGTDRFLSTKSQKQTLFRRHFSGERAFVDQTYPVSLTSAEVSLLLLIGVGAKQTEVSTTTTTTAKQTELDFFCSFRPRVRFHPPVLSTTATASPPTTTKSASCRSGTVSPRVCVSRPYARRRKHPWHFP